MITAEWITVILVTLLLVIYLGDSFVVFINDIKKALADGRLDEEEMMKLEKDAKVIIRLVIKMTSLFRKV